MGTSASPNRDPDRQCLDTFKDIWEPLNFTHTITTKRFRYLQGYMGTTSVQAYIDQILRLDTFKDIWERIGPRGCYKAAKFRYLQGYMGTSSSADSGTASTGLDTFKDIWERHIFPLCRRKVYV